jgi:UDP-N-acetylmuramoyl-tripeptide--D-alanyl-D-alanine ligase
VVLMGALWTAAEAAAATGGQTTAEWAARGVSIDTRTLQPGDLFVALKAARDGHEFVAAALAAGAAAALVSHRPEGVAPDAPLLIVPDVLRALEDLGRAARARTRARVVAVTGSVGKTSTKEMLRAALSGQGATHASVASYNNHWGVPLTLARMPRETRYAVIEIGMNHPGEIAPLARLARPHVVMVTTIAAAHLEAFADRGGLDGIAVEKASICEGLEPGGVAVLHGDVPQTPILISAARGAGARAVTFGMGPANHHRIAVARIVDGVTVAEGRAWRTPVLFKVRSEGRHFAVNAMGVLACATALGADRTLALLGLDQWQPPPGRGTRERLILTDGREGDAIELIDDAFNANPASLSAALDVLAAARPEDGVGRLAKGRRVAILGDMLEMGPQEMAIHAQMAADRALAQVDLVHCAGPRMRALYDALPAGQRGRWAERAEDLVPEARRLIDAGDVVLVKGSKGSRVSLIVDAIRKLGHRPAGDE